MVQKEIYMYRTIHKDKSDRRKWLEGRLDTIQHQVYDGMNGELLLGQPPAKIPPNFDPDNPNSDEGFKDLSGDEYIRYRLENLLAENIRTLKQYEGAWTRQQIYILLASGVGILLAAIGDSYSIWVAVTTTLMVVLIGWHGLQNFDLVVKNCRKVITELMTIYDRWNMLEPEERTNDEFFRLVTSTEDVFLGQKIEYIRSIQDVLAKETPEDTELIESSLEEVVVTDEAIKDQKPDREIEVTSQVIEDVLAEEETPEDTELIESTLGEVVETEAAIKDQKSDSQIEVSSQVIEDIFPEETPEEPELVESALQDVVEVEAAFKDQKSDSEVDISPQALDDVLADETLEEPDLVESESMLTIEPEEVITSKAKETAGEKSGELINEEVLDEVTGSLAEEASSELVQAEFAAMAEAASQAGFYTVSADHAEAGRLSDTLDAIAKEFKDVDIGRDTPANVLNDLLSRYPNTNEVKG